MTAFVPMVVVLVGLLVCSAVTVVIYNRLVRGRILVREGFSGIDVQLKRRHDLIPNLVAAVEGYADFEREVLDKVTRLRSQAMQDESLADKERDENALAGALKQFFAVAEGYPDLKASSSFLDLQRQLVEVEDTLQKARRYYNGTVRDFNTEVQSFPSNLVAGLFGFENAKFFQLKDATEAEAPNIAIGGD